MTMQIKVTQALKPCPFCGGRTQWVEDTGEVGTPFGLVSDHQENCFLGPHMMENWDNIFSAWNTRASTAPDAEPVAPAVVEAAKFRLGDRVKIVAPEWEQEPPHYITGIDWHPKHGVTYTTSEVWPPKVSGLFVQGLTDEWRPEDLALAAMGERA